MRNYYDQHNSPNACSDVDLLVYNGCVRTRETPLLYNFKLDYISMYNVAEKVRMLFEIILIRSTVQIFRHVTSPKSD